MKKSLFIAATLLMAAVSVSAAKKEKAAEKDAPMYAIKSGIIITNTDMEEMSEMFGGVDFAQMQERFANREGADTLRPAFDFTNTESIEMVYFDDYGAKRATVSKMGGRTTRTVTDKDGATITINEEEKTATKMPSFGNGRGGGFGGGFGGFGMGGGTAPVNFNALDAKTIKKNKVKELGQEEVAGKLCTIYSVRVMMMQQYVTNKYWVYKGIVLKSETAGFMSDTPITTKVTELQENAEIPAGIFDVPADVTVREMDFGGMDFGGFGGDFGGGGFGGGGFGGGGFGGGGFGGF